MRNKTVNGYPIIAWAAIPDAEGYRVNRSVILVDRGLDHRQRYVVAGYVDGETSWDQGQYITQIGDAIEAFTERWKRKVL